MKTELYVSKKPIKKKLNSNNNLNYLNSNTLDSISSEGTQETKIFIQIAQEDKNNAE